MLLLNSLLNSVDRLWSKRDTSVTRWFMPRRLAARTYPFLPFAAFLVLLAAERAAYCQA